MNRATAAVDGADRASRVDTALASSLTAVGRGFEAPAQAAQLSFRCLLDATARPGTVQQLPSAALAGIEPPAGWSPGLCALLLTLLDAETSLHLGGGERAAALQPYLRFHTGVRISPTAAEADFVLAVASQADGPLWQQPRWGSDLVPQQGATLIVVLEVPGSMVKSPDAAPPGANRLSLRGPGIRDRQVLAVTGIAPAFWLARAEMARAFPRGVDLLLICGDAVVAVPRSSQLQLEG